MITLTQMVRVMKLHNDGVSIGAIATKLRISNSCVKYYLYNLEKTEKHKYKTVYAHGKHVRNNTNYISNSKSRIRLHEFSKLVKYLIDNDIPYRNLSEHYNSMVLMYRIRFLTKKEGVFLSVIFGEGSFGFVSGLLEICELNEFGLINDPEGYKTADEIISKYT